MYFKIKSFFEFVGSNLAVKLENKLIIAGCALVSLTWSSIAVSHHLVTEEKLKNFTLPAPAKSSMGNEYWLWGTYYYTPEYVSKDSGHPLISMNGSYLGPKLTTKEWCTAALEGSTAVRQNGKLVTYNYAGLGRSMQVNCNRYHKYSQSGRVRFKVASGPYGDGSSSKSKKYILFPYRTIAADRYRFPLGTLLYIPEAKGIKINLKSGKQFTHDGYFLVGDRGGAVGGSHIDFFQGFEPVPGFGKIAKSTSSRKFKAYVVNNERIRRLLERAHMKSSGLLKSGDY